MWIARALTQWKAEKKFSQLFPTNKKYEEKVCGEGAALSLHPPPPPLPRVKRKERVANLTLHTHTYINFQPLEYDYYFLQPCVWGCVT